MARKPRIISPSGMYHIYFCGNGGCKIFSEKADFEKFVSLLKVLKDYCYIYAYGFEKNCGRMFIKTEDVGFIMKRLFTGYAMWYNKKYNRSGTLFGSRYKSEPVSEVLSVGLARYIMKAKGYTSLEDYINGSGITDTDYILSQFESLSEFVKFMDSPEPFTYGADGNKNTALILKNIQNATKGRPFLELDSEEREKAVRSLVAEGMKKTAVARELGVSRGTVEKAINPVKKSYSKRVDDIVLL